MYLVPCTVRVDAAQITNNEILTFKPHVNLPNYYYLNGCDPDIAWGIPVSTATPDEEASLAVFPNPTRSKVVLQRSAGDFSPVKWHLFNAQGILVRQELLVGNQQEVDLNKLPSGTYFWRLENTTQMGRLVIFD